MLDRRRVAECLLHGLAHRDPCAAPERVVGGDHDLRAPSPPAAGRSRVPRTRRRSAPARRRCGRRHARQPLLPGTSACRSQRDPPARRRRALSASASRTVSCESSANVHSRRAPSSPRKTAAVASGVRSAQAWTHALAMFSRAPTNHVVHSMPRESSSTSSHGRPSSSPRSSTTARQKRSGSSTETRCSEE